MLTSRTVRSETDFDRVLVDVRRVGYATNRDEALLGFTSVGRPDLRLDGGRPSRDLGGRAEPRVRPVL